MLFPLLRIGGLDIVVNNSKFILMYYTTLFSIYFLIATLIFIAIHYIYRSIQKKRLTTITKTITIPWFHLPHKKQLNLDALD